MKELHRPEYIEYAAHPDSDLLVKDTFEPLARLFEVCLEECVHQREILVQVIASYRKSYAARHEADYSYRMSHPRTILSSVLCQNHRPTRQRLLIC